MSTDPEEDRDRAVLEARGESLLTAIVLMPLGLLVVGVCRVTDAARALHERVRCWPLRRPIGRLDGEPPIAVWGTLSNDDIDRLTRGGRA